LARLGSFGMRARSLPALAGHRHAAAGASGRVECRESRTGRSEPNCPVTPAVGVIRRSTWHDERMDAHSLFRETATAIEFDGVAPWRRALVTGPEALARTARSAVRTPDGTGEAPGV